MKPVEIPNHPYLKELNAFRKKIFDNINLNCFKDQLNLSENGEIVLLEVEAGIIIGSAMSKCIKIDKYDFTNTLLDYGINEYDRTEHDVSCLKYFLQTLEPESKFAKNSIVNEDLEQQCSFYPTILMYPFTTFLNKYKHLAGDLKDITCGVLSDKDVQIFSYKAVLIVTEKDMELKKSESEDLFAAVTEKLHKLVDCILSHA